jgi:hypothetical protein
LVASEYRTVAGNVRHESDVSIVAKLFADLEKFGHRHRGEPAIDNESIRGHDTPFVM